MTIIIKNKYTLLYEDFSFKCCVGLNGFTKIKKEGDKKTPRGLFGIGDLYYRRDKNIKPQTKLSMKSYIEMIINMIFLYQ